MVRHLTLEQDLPVHLLVARQQLIFNFLSRRREIGVAE